MKPEKQRRAEFDQLLLGLGGDDNEKRRQAEERLEQLPAEEQVALLKSFCGRDETQKNAALLWFLVAVTPIFLIALLWSSIAEGKWFHAFWLLGLVALKLVFRPGQSRIAKQPATEGAIHLLLRLNKAELAPSLIQMLPYLQARRQKEDDPLYQVTLETLARHLPEYQAANLPVLTRKERNLLQKQVERLTARLDHPSPALTDGEANFLVAALAILHPSGESPKQSRTKSVQRLTRPETREDLSENWRFVAEAVQEQVVSGQTRR